MLEMFDTTLKKDARQADIWLYFWNSERVENGLLYLCGVENVHDLGEDGVALVLVLLADELDVPQLAEVEIPLLLQAVHCELQVHQLRRRDTEGWDAQWRASGVQ